MLSVKSRRQFFENNPSGKPTTNQAFWRWHNGVRSLFCKLRAVGLACRQSAAIFSGLLLLASNLHAAGNQFNTWDWEVNNWSKVRVVAQSSSVSSATSQKVTKFVQHLKQWDIRRFVPRASVYAGADLNALKAPL